MSTLFELEDGSSAADETTKEYEIETGGFDLIPDRSSVLAMIDDATWKWPGHNFGEEDERIELRWTVVAPEELEGRKIFQKLWVTDYEPNTLKKGEDKARKKRDKARRMLAAIDANAGGKLSKIEGMPQSQDLMTCLSNKPMVIKVMVWEMPDRENPGEKVRGNWIAAVAPKNAEVKVTEKAAKKSAPSTSETLDGDDIPF